MKIKKNTLTVKNSSKKSCLTDITCFEAHESYNKLCENTACRYWIKSPHSHNCTLVGSKNGTKTLQEIGDIFDITRMRICQIEKCILKKLTKKKRMFEH